MFRTINARLLLSYIVVILVCLVLVGLGLLLFVRTSPLWTGATFARLDEAERETMHALLRAEPLESIGEQELHTLLTRQATAQETRILLLDTGGRVLFDSAADWVGSSIPEVVDARVIRRPRIQGSFVSPDGQRWFFVGQTLPAGDARRQVIVFTSQPKRLLLLFWFADNLLLPLLRAGMVALVISVLLAWLVARSVARPLRRVAATATAIAQGDLTERAPVSGPQEVQDMAQAFNRMAEQVTSTQQAQRDFVANVSHELKTPLTAIQGFSQAILDGTAADADGITRAAEIINQEAQRMQRMVNDLLHLARFDAGQAQMTRHAVEIGSLLQRCVERMAPQAQANGDEILVDSAPGLVVSGDPDWLTQVFVNLLDNGIRHTHDGQVQVTAKRDGSWVEVVVTDSGEGIPPADLERIFERFYQADKSRRHKGGVGLGLPIAREVVQMHGGDIVVESVVGLGSRFTVRLPAAGDPAAPPREGNTSPGGKRDG